MTVTRHPSFLMAVRLDPYQRYGYRRAAPVAVSIRAAPSQ
jgi:hypothetical protein